MAQYLQEAMDPNRQAEDMEFVKQLLVRLNQDHRPGEPAASKQDSPMSTAYFGHAELAGQAIYGVWQTLCVHGPFMEKTDCLLNKAQKYSMESEAFSGPEHAKWVEEFCGNECKDVLNSTSSKELMLKCKDMEPKAAAEEICGKLQTARQDYVGRVIKFQCILSIINLIAMYCQCKETFKHLEEINIQCRGYDEQLENIETSLNEEETTLTEMTIRLNESRPITAMEICSILMKLTGIRQQLELIKQDLEHKKENITHRWNGHISGAAAGAVNMIRAFVDYSLAIAAGVSTLPVLAAGALNSVATAGHVYTAAKCKEVLGMIEKRLVTVKGYENRVKNIAQRVESLTQQLRMMYAAPAAQANIYARAIPSPVA